MSVPPPVPNEQPAIAELARLLAEKGDTATPVARRSPTNVPSLDVVRQHRAGILASANRYRIGNVQITGVVAYGDHLEAGTLDLVVDPGEGGPERLEKFKAEVRQLVGCPVEIITSADSEGPLGAVLNDTAIPL